MRAAQFWAAFCFSESGELAADLSREDILSGCACPPDLDHDCCHKHRSYAHSLEEADAFSNKGRGKKYGENRFQTTSHYGPRGITDISGR